MAIHDAGMFTVKKTNRLKILQDVIDRNLRPGQAAEMLSITPRHGSQLVYKWAWCHLIVHYFSVQYISL
ncbi:TPA: hypothetical protein ACIUKL_002594 [Salmonella enterica subsp. enterica serovar 4,5,12:b:-]|uniref:hypothetical protein n=1 Tax=Salmonella enterica TaxID=28901 RepID=UPI0029706AED|nr:hypothetical protein [Salmonella enterica]